MQSSPPAAPPVIRSRAFGCWSLKQNSLGRYLVPVPDPLATDELTKDHIEGFELSSDYVKISDHVWQRWVQLCFHLVDKVKSTTEVSVRLLRKEDDPSKWRIVVPPQSVSRASVTTADFKDSLDIETGEPIGSWPPEGWIPMGSSHSHNTMAAFFSGTDDTYELGDPGIHIVVGGINVKTRRYSMAASIVAPRPVGSHANTRFKLQWDSLLDGQPLEACTFHPDVLKLIRFDATTYSSNAHWENSTVGKGGFGQIFGNASQRVHRQLNGSRGGLVKRGDRLVWNEGYDDLNSWHGTGYDDADDPFYFNDGTKTSTPSTKYTSYQVADFVKTYIDDLVKGHSFLRMESLYNNLTEVLGDLAEQLAIAEAIDITSQEKDQAFFDSDDDDETPSEALIAAIEEELIDLDATQSNVTSTAHDSDSSPSSNLLPPSEASTLLADPAGAPEPLAHHA